MRYPKWPVPSGGDVLLMKAGEDRIPVIVVTSYEDHTVSVLGAQAVLYPAPAHITVGSKLYRFDRRHTAKLPYDEANFIVSRHGEFGPCPKIGEFSPQFVRHLLGVAR